VGLAATDTLQSLSIGDFQPIMRALHRPDVGGTQRWLIVTPEYPAIFTIVNASAPHP
jgi:hypothetical protein